MTLLLTRDPELSSLLEIAERAARTHANVLLTGESGTGKNRLARAIHAASARAARPFVEVHCANLPADLLESELFGHVEGAFTGARRGKAGRFERADGGTLFLDEVQELAPEVQAKVLRAVQEMKFERVGGSDPVSVDVRIVSALTGEPERLVESGRLREDLFYRLHVVRIDLPPLRDRPDDIPLLASEFLEEVAAMHGLPRKTLSEEALRRLRLHDWPGNVRELRHAIESAAVVASGEAIGPGDLPRTLSAASPSLLRAAAAASRTLADLERDYIDEVLARTRGNKTAAARILGIHRKTLHEKLRASRRPAEPRD